MKRIFNIFILKNIKLYFIINTILYFSFVHSINPNSFEILFLNNNLVSFAEDQVVDHTSGPNENCILIYNETLYDFTELSNEIREVENDNNKILFQFCNNIPGNKSSVIYLSEDNKIIKLSGDINGEQNNKNKVTHDATEKAVILHLAKGEKCGRDNSQNYDFKIKLFCNSTYTFKFIEINNYDPMSTCNFELKAYSKYACGDNEAYSKSKFLKDYKIIFGIFFCIIGPLIGILGYKYLNIGIILVCVVSFPIALRYLIYDLFDINIEIVLYVIVVLGLLIGGGIAYFLTRREKNEKIYICILGGIFGYLIAKFIYDVLITLIEMKHQKLIYYILLTTLTIIGVIVGIYLHKLMCIIGTSTMGGYIFMRGISLFLIDVIEYFDEKKVFDYARTRNYEKISEMIGPKFYIYPAMWVVFTLIFIIVQSKKNRINYKNLGKLFDKEEGILSGEYQDTVGSSCYDEELKNQENNIN